MSEPKITPPTIKQYVNAAMALVDATALLIEVGESPDVIKTWLMGDPVDDRNPLLVLIEDRDEFMSRARQFAAE